MKKTTRTLSTGGIASGKPEPPAATPAAINEELIAEIVNAALTPAELAKQIADITPPAQDRAPSPWRPFNTQNKQIPDFGCDDESTQAAPSK